MKFKEGDRVRVRPDLNMRHSNVVESMVMYAGKFTTVTRVNLTSYRIDADNNSWNWDENTLIAIDGGTMEKPNTPQEKEACKQAIEEAVQEVISTKKAGYKTEMNAWLTLEKSARQSRKDADAKRSILGLTDKQVKELFE